MGTVKNLTKMFTWCISKFCCLNKFVPNDLKNVNSVKTASVLQESHDNLHESMKLDINSKLIGQTLILLKDIVQLFWWTLSTDENATVGIQTWMAKYTFKLKERQPFWARAFAWLGCDKNPSTCIMLFCLLTQTFVVDSFAVTLSWLFWPFVQLQSWLKQGIPLWNLSSSEQPESFHMHPPE